MIAEHTETRANATAEIPTAKWLMLSDMDRCPQGASFTQWSYLVLEDVSPGSSTRHPRHWHFVFLLEPAFCCLFLMLFSTASPLDLGVASQFMTIIQWRRARADARSLLALKICDPYI